MQFKVPLLRTFGLLLYYTGQVFISFTTIGVRFNVRKKKIKINKTKTIRMDED